MRMLDERRLLYASCHRSQNPKCACAVHNNDVVIMMCGSFNPRRACARVTVLVLCVCVYPSVCLFPV